MQNLWYAKRKDTILKMIALELKDSRKNDEAGQKETLAWFSQQLDELAEEALVGGGLDYTNAGKILGAMTSAKKSEASRQNGKKGGRPRRKPADASK